MVRLCVKNSKLHKESLKPLYNWHICEPIICDFIMAKIYICPSSHEGLMKMRGSSSEQVLLIYKGNLRIGRRLKETNSYIADVAEY